MITIKAQSKFSVPQSFMPPSGNVRYRNNLTMKFSDLEQDYSLAQPPKSIEKRVQMLAL